MRQDATLEELEGLRRQFNMLIDKVEQQPVVSEQMLRNTMENGISAVEKEYRMRFRVYFLSPVLFVSLLCMGIGWPYVLFGAVIAVIEYILTKRCYKILAPRELMGLSMTEAVRKVAEFKKMRLRIREILVVPGAVLCVWTVLEVCKYSWNVPIISLTVIALILAFLNLIRKEKKVNRSLEDVLNGIKNLRG